MITNEAQFSGIKQQLVKINRSIKDFDFQQACKRTGSEANAKAEFEAMAGEAVKLGKEMREYVSKFGPSTRTSFEPKRKKAYRKKW